MKYKNILFDLDGTLADSAPGIIAALVHALHTFGRECKDTQSLYYYIGPSLFETLWSDYGLTREQAEEAVQVYRAYYGANTLFQLELYEGIIDLLQYLHGHGCTLMVASSKPTPMVLRVLREFKLLPYFSYVEGADPAKMTDDKDEIIAAALQKANIPEEESTVMIGDRSYDIWGAKACGVQSIGVLYGYGTRGELEQAAPDYIVNSVAELRAVLTREAE